MSSGSPEHVRCHSAGIPSLGSLSMMPPSQRDIPPLMPVAPLLMAPQPDQQRLPLAPLRPVADGSLTKQLEAVRYQKSMVQERCFEVEFLIRQRSFALQAERARLADEEALLEERWLQLCQARSEAPSAAAVTPPAPQARTPVLRQAEQAEEAAPQDIEESASQELEDWREPLPPAVAEAATSAPATPPPTEDLPVQESSLGDLRRQLAVDRRSLDEERRRVDEAAARADAWLQQTSELGREQAAFWQACANSRREKEDALEATLESRLAQQLSEAKASLACLEVEENEHMREVVAVGDERSCQAMALCKGQAAHWEAQASNLRGVEESRTVDLQTRIEAKAYEAEARLEKAEQLSQAELRVEACQDEEAWLGRLEAHMRQEELAEVLSAEEAAKRHESRVEAWCVEERMHHAARDEACTEAWLVYAWAEAQARVSEEAAAMREECRSRENLLAQEAAATEAAEEESRARRAAAALEDREAEYEQQLAAVEASWSPHDSVEARALRSELQALHQERLACREEMACYHSRSLTSAAGGSPQPSALCSEPQNVSKSEEEPAAGFRNFLRQGAAREEAFRERMAAHTEVVRNEYRAQVDDLLATTARLEEEKIQLAEERRRLLLGQHRTAVESPGAFRRALGSSLQAAWATQTRPQPWDVSTGPVGVPTDQPGSWEVAAGVESPSTTVSLGSSAVGYSAGHSSGNQSTPVSHVLFERMQESMMQHAQPKQVVPRVPLDTMHAAAGLEDAEGNERGPSASSAQRSGGWGNQQLRLPIPPVYVSAIATVERYGWAEVHDSGPEWTALHWAASEGRTDVVGRLLAAGADPQMPDHVGRSALDYAQAQADASGDTSALEMLQEAIDS
mmetsp:Transcript_35795/g.66753  ORF Transcript_35795/g.66753 Transcript_35795/m.66753 type:complete len:860 (+) Transcript_35795:153-2732(+)